MLAMETLYEDIGTVYQSVHTYYLIVGMKIPTYKDIPEPPQNGTKTCTFDRTFNFIAWKNLAKEQCNFFNSLFHQLEQEGSHLYTKVFQVLHSDIPTLLPNQEIKFLSETEHPLNEEEDPETDANQTRSKRSTDDILNMPEKHRLESYWFKYHKLLPSDFDTLYSEDTTCDICDQQHREKRFISALIKGLRGVTRGASIFGRLISSVKKIGGSIFKGIHGLFHHHKVQAIYRAVNTFKKYHSKLKIGELFKFKAYCDLHISKVSLYDKLNKVLHKFGNRMNHKTFLRYIYNTDKTTWYYDNYDNFAQFWTQGLEMLFLNHEKRIFQSERLFT